MDTKRKNEEAEQQGQALLKAGQERQAVAEAEANRTNEEAEQQRVAAAEDDRKRAEAGEREANRFVREGSTVPSSAL